MSKRYHPLSPLSLLREVWVWAEERADGSRFPAWVWLLVPLAMFAALVAVRWWVVPHYTGTEFAFLVLALIAAGCLIVGVVRSLRDL